jgi:hypothetical protein
MESELPSDLNRAENMLEEHKRKKQEISHLINYTAEEGEKIVVRVRQTVSSAYFLPKIIHNDAPRSASWKKFLPYFTTCYNK